MSVENPQRFDADPDPACHFDMDLDPDPACHFAADPDTDPDPTFHFDADTDPSFKMKAQTLKNCKNRLNSHSLSSAN